MKIFHFSILLTIFINCSEFSNQQKPIQKSFAEQSLKNSQDTLFLFFDANKDEFYELGVPAGYINQKNDTIISLGKYYGLFGDSISTFAKVLKQTDSGLTLLGLDLKGNYLFDVYWFDNGPDYIVEGLFRIKKGNKIGYADSLGNVVIEPQFSTAFPFNEGKAKVAFESKQKRTKDGEYIYSVSDNWFYINKEGQIIE